MFQRFRSLATSALVAGFVAAFACSAPVEEDDDEGLDGDSSGSDSSSANSSSANGDTTSGTNTNGSSANGASSTGDSGSSGGTGGTSAGSGSSATSASSSGTTGPSVGGDLGEACAGVPYDGGGFEDEACVGTGYEAESFPIDLVLMVDVSTSMVDHEVDGVTRWDLVHDALVDFVTDPAAEDIGMGIQFWSWLPGDDQSCSIDKYATPAVPIGELGEIQDQIVEVLDEQAPTGLTPTYPALAGAIQYAKGHASEHPERQAVVVFVTDGYPTECEPTDIPAIAELAAASWNESPRIPVFIVGIDGVYNLDQIAQAGGTREPFLVENDGSTDRLVSALKNITTDTARCEFEIPPSPNPDFLSPDTEAVQVIYTPGSGDPQEIPRVTGYAACATAENGGWYTGGFDADGKPTKIVVCPCSCANFAAGAVEVTLGCKATPSVE